MPVPARDRHGDGAAARLRLRELGHGLRRLPDGPRHGDAAAVPVAREDRDGDLRHRRRGDGRAGRGRARGRSCKRQIATAAEMGFQVKTGSELEFYLFKDSFDELAERGYRDPRPSSTLHHGLPHAADHEGRVVHPADPQRHAGRRHPHRVLEGRVRQGPARDQHHVLRRAVERRPSRDLQARREGDRGAERRRRHVHGEVDDGRGRARRCHLHSSVWNADGAESPDVDRRRRAPHVRHLPLVPRRADGDGARDGVDVRAVRELLQALPARLVGADRDRVEPRQPHVRVPHGRRAQGRPGRVPASRAPTRTRTSRSRPRSRAACGGSATEIEPPAMFVGNAYEAKDVPRVPTRCTRRSTRSAARRSRARRSATSCSSTC